MKLLKTQTSTHSMKKYIALEKKIPDTTTLIHINQYNTDKQNLGKKLEVLIKKYQIQVV